jgi:hypothetical protein
MMSNYPPGVSESDEHFNPSDDDYAVVTWPEHRRDERVRIVNSPSENVFNVVYVGSGESAVIHADNLVMEGDV